MKYASISLYYSFVGGDLVTQHSKAQNVVVRSSIEVEFRTLAHDICGVRIKRLVEEYKFFRRDFYVHTTTTRLSSLSIAHNPVQHDGQNILKLTNTS